VIAADIVGAMISGEGVVHANAVEFVVDGAGVVEAASVGFDKVVGVNFFGVLTIDFGVVEIRSV
jgi:hypothetical protein